MPRTGSLVRTPVTSYRLQLRPGFGFREATAIVEYLAALGVTECYSSPQFQAKPHSMHGYDVCNPNALNPDLGTAEDYDAFTAALSQSGLGLMLDIVPNHMSSDPSANLWWRDVLEHGRWSPYAEFFDIDWEPVKAELRHKLLLPILGRQYGEALESGELTLASDSGAIALHYRDMSLPIDPRTSADVLAPGAESIDLPAGDPHLMELWSVITALRHLPHDAAPDPVRIVDRQRESAQARRRLQQLTVDAPWFAEHLQRTLAMFNGIPGDADSFDRLHALLEAQAYRLAYWRTSAHEINYRRFFDVDELIGVRMEDPAVFDATHQLLRKLIAERRVTGLRVDHPDGLALPADYFARLQQLAASALGRPDDDMAIHAVVEKILLGTETLPPAWRVHGTTGYQFLNTVNGLFISGSGVHLLRRLYGRLTGDRGTFSDIAYEAKKLIMDTALASEVNMLAQALNRISERDRRRRDFTLNSLRRALVEFVACLAVYRTYLSPGVADESDVDRIGAALRRARRRNPELEPTIFDFLGDVLLSADGFCLRVQQYAGPVQAKGVEDTAFYRYNLLLSLNEVGGDPGRPGRSVADFHQLNQRRLADWPLDVSATATHDTKLGEDVRTRLDTLSEMPDRWRRQLGRWMRITRRHRTHVDGEWAPDRNDEYRFYQTIVGVWPIDAGDLSGPPRIGDSLVDRISAYMRKSAKEAKVHTSWVNDNHAYDDALEKFVRASLQGGSGQRLLATALPFIHDVARVGMINSLSQTVLKIASPGVPDFYQGTELWDLHLVDPDNREPVDFDRRAAWLRDLEPALRASAEDGSGNDELIRTLFDAWPDGRIKLFVIAAALRSRRAHAQVFLHGNYTPLHVETSGTPDLVAFARHDDRQAALALVPRMVAHAMTIGGARLPVGSVWGGAVVRVPAAWPHRAFRNVFTGAVVHANGDGVLSVSELLSTCPVGLFMSTSD